MPDVTDAPAANRYEFVEDSHTAYAEYRIEDGTITFTHTIVPPEIEGRGVASRLVRHALDDARNRGLRVVAQCSFVAGYLDRHPEYRDLLA